MPNWVYNNITITGDDKKLTVLSDFFGKSYTLSSGEKVEQCFSFFNIISPADLEAYTKNWYDWNRENWGTKWEACEPALETNVGMVEYTFNTAWSPPVPIMDWLFDMCEKEGLDFIWSYEEEQGWGGELALSNGVKHEKIYDIPTSHSENVEREVDCVCFYENDARYWFRDCPQRTTLMEVEE